MEAILGESEGTVLLVDDSPTVRALTRLALAEHGYRFLEASDGLEAVQLATEKRPGLIVMDVNLPSMSGLEALRAIRGSAETKHIPVIMMSVRTGPQETHEWFASGCDAYLSKPVNASELAHLVERYLGGK